MPSRRQLRRGDAIADSDVIADSDLAQQAINNEILGPMSLSMSRFASMSVVGGTQAVCSFARHGVYFCYCFCIDKKW